MNFKFHSLELGMVFLVARSSPSTHRDPIWAPVLILAALLPNQLPARVPEKTVEDTL